MPYREKLCRYLPQAVADALRALSAQEAARLEEIRIYAGRAVQLIFGGRCRETNTRVAPQRMDDLLAALSGHALYSCEAQMADGYIPLPGGHRAGVCGHMTCQMDGTWRMGKVSSICIRICRAVPGASRPVRPYLLDENGATRSVLLLGTPGCGKTTVLRDAAIYLSEKRGLRVAAADEREELFGMGQDAAACGVDVLCGTDKARAFTMLIRSMAPQVIVTDEIGREGDVDALLDAVRCGVAVLASAHAGGMEDIGRRPALMRLMQARAFDRYILLGRHGCVLSVCDETGCRMDKEEKRYGQLGCGRDGDDRDQCDRLFALGR